MQWDEAVNNAKLNAIEVEIGSSPFIRKYTGTMPAQTSDSATGTQLAELQLPADWLADAIGHEKHQLGVWQDLSADASGQFGYFRIYKQDGVTCVGQGSITLTGLGGDLQVSDLNVVIGEPVSITGFMIAAGNR